MLEAGANCPEHAEIGEMKTTRVTIIVLLLLAAVGLPYFFGRPKPPNGLHLGVVYLISHPAIDDGLAGLREGLKAIEEKAAISITVDYTNAFGEMANVSRALDAYKAAEVDAVLALTTPCAQLAHRKITDRPVIFVGVTDPIGAGLVDSLSTGKGNIVGTTSRVPHGDILKLASVAFPSLKRIGIVYTSSEANSLAIIAKLEDYLQSSHLGITLVKRSISATSEIYRTTQALIREVDGVFVINDNTVVSAVEILVRACNEAGIPIIASDRDSVERGALFAYAVDYKKEGLAAASLVESVCLKHDNPSELPVYINRDTHLYVNKQLYTLFPEVDVQLFVDAKVLE